MNIYYKIIEIHPENLTFVVRYWTDTLSEEDLAADKRNKKIDGSPLRCKSDVSYNIPVAKPTIEELDREARYRAPYQWLKEEAERLQFLNSKPDLKYLDTLIDQQKKVTSEEIEEYKFNEFKKTIKEKVKEDE